MNVPTDKGINIGINKLSDSVINKRCRIYSSKESPLSASAVEKLIKQTPEWHFAAKAHALVRIFHFQNYYQTIDFVNHLADICHDQDHHPELTVSYQRCEVAFNTHTVNGVTENDFICAAIIDRIKVKQLK